MALPCNDDDKNDKIYMKDGYAYGIGCGATADEAADEACFKSFLDVLDSIQRFIDKVKCEGDCIVDWCFAGNDGVGECEKVICLHRKNRHCCLYRSIWRINYWCEKPKKTGGQFLASMRQGARPIDTDTHS